MGYRESFFAFSKKLLIQLPGRVRGDGGMKGLMVTAVGGTKILVFVIYAPPTQF